jgi:GNAT superfamily N-acetyltransferase
MIPKFKQCNVGDTLSAFEFKHFWQSMEDEGRPSVLLLLKSDFRVVGLLGFVLFTDPLTGLRYAAEVIWNVDQGFVGEGWGMKLLEESERIAREEGCQRMVLHCSAMGMNRLQKKIEPRGYKPYQAEFLKEL